LLTRGKLNQNTTSRRYTGPAEHPGFSILLSGDTGSTAISDFDYQAVHDVVTIPAGQTSAYIAVTPDATGSIVDKTLVYDADAGTGYVVGPTIRKNRKPQRNRCARI
jgi:hypothetical protein